MITPVAHLITETLPSGLTKKIFTLSIPPTLLKVPVK